MNVLQNLYEKFMRILHSLLCFAWVYCYCWNTTDKAQNTIQSINQSIKLSWWYQFVYCPREISIHFKAFPCISSILYCQSDQQTWDNIHSATTGKVWFIDFRPLKRQSNGTGCHVKVNSITLLYNWFSITTVC